MSENDMHRQISPHALKAAEAIANYCLTRFPTDTPPHALLDVPWFAEKIDKAIRDAISEEVRRTQAWRDLCKELYKHSNKCMGMLGEAVPCLRAQRGSIPQHLAADIIAYVESAFIQTPTALREECGQMLAEMHPEE